MMNPLRRRRPQPGPYAEIVAALSEWYGEFRLTRHRGSGAIDFARSGAIYDVEMVAGEEESVPVVRARAFSRGTAPIRAWCLWDARQPGQVTITLDGIADPGPGPWVGALAGRVRAEAARLGEARRARDLELAEKAAGDRERDGQKLAEASRAEWPL